MPDEDHNLPGGEGALENGAEPLKSDEATSLALQIVREQIASLEQEQNRLRSRLESEQAARLEAEKRAATAEAELRALRQLEPDIIPGKAEELARVSELPKDGDAEPKSSRYDGTEWWQFWKRWKRQEPWGFGNPPRDKK